MRVAFSLIPAVALAAAVVPTLSLAQSAPSVEQVLAEEGLEPVRHVAFDLCWPADGGEYAELGKQGVVRLESATAIAGELPLQAVYVEARGIKFPLRRIAELARTQDEPPADPQAPQYDRQVSFFLLPLNLTKIEGKLSVDFRGQRTEFGVISFPISDQTPAFARLDAYDTPAEPDAQALTALLLREYPDDFPSR